MSILTLQRSAGNAATTALLALQRSDADKPVGAALRPPIGSGRAPGRVLARAWEKKPQKKGGRGINTANSGVKKRLLALVPDMQIVEAGQMAVDPGSTTWRIDHQGPSHGPNGEDYVSMAAQVESATFASCHCPASWGIEQRRAGMAEAIRQNDAIWWVPEPAAEEEEKKAPPPKKGPKGGGGKGGGGKKAQAASYGGKRVKV